MECDPHVREHLHQAKQSMREAHGSVSSHLRDAARHLLQAGLAALDAREAKTPPAAPAAKEEPEDKPAPTT